MITVEENKIIYSGTTAVIKQTTRWLKLTLLLVSSLTIMSIITISPALPQMTAAFSKVANAGLLVKLVLTIPALMIAVFSPFAGRLIDRYGRLKMLRLSLVVYALAGTAGFFLNNLYFILLSRAILGVAVGISMTIVITLIADYFDGLERQQFVGIQISFMSVGGILFTGLGGLLADVGWRYPFLLYLLALMILPLTFIYLHEPAAIKKVQKIQSVKAPAITWLLFVNIMLMWIIFFLIPVQIPFYLKAIGVEKNVWIGVGIAMSTVSSAVSSFFYSGIKTRLSFLAVFAVGYLLMSIGFVGMAVANTYLLVVIAMMVSGCGMGIMIPNTNLWVMKIIPPEIRGKEIGKLTTFWFLGQFLSPIVTFPLLSKLTLAATFMLAASILLILSVGFGVFHFSNAGKRVVLAA